MREARQMNLRRIWIEPGEVPSPLSVGDVFELPASSFHHAIEVSRFETGETFEGVTGQPQAMALRITEIKKKSARGEVLSLRRLPTLGRPRVQLAFAISKWETTESVIEKSVELGVSVFQPLFTENSFAKKPEDIRDARIERWQRIVRSATTQTARGDLMELLAPKSLDEFLNGMHRNEMSACLFAYEGPCVQDIRSALQDIKKSDPERIWAIVGSEGGFSSTEVEKIRSMNVIPSTMGPQILRAETACLAIVSVIKYEMGLMVMGSTKT